MGKFSNLNGSPAGRWPANVMHDGSEEAIAGFPQTGPAKQANRGRGYGDGIFSNDCNYSGTLRGHDDAGGSAARFFYCAKASKADRDEGLDAFAEIHRVNGNKWTDQDYRVSRGERPPSAESGPRRNHHPTVKPSALMRHLVRLVTQPEGLILDPFSEKPPC
jgi:site-specific DNA-methyltransferase (adenine-specific)